MNYEEKYNKALEVMRQWIAPCHTKEQLDTLKKSVSPELAESEDERIREEIIDIVEAYRANCVYEGTHRFDDCLAYLEKQKEQKELPLMNDDADLYFDTWRQGVSVPTFRQCFEEGIKYNQRLQKEQKPAEWGEEERKILDSIIDDYEKASKSFCGYDGKILVLKAIRDGNLPKPAWSEEDEERLKAICTYLQDYPRLAKINDVKRFNEYCDWLKSLPWNLKKKNEDVAKLCSNEWSEEDTEMYINVASSLNGYACGLKNEEHKKHIKKGLDWLENRFKSLRSQSRWKPSEVCYGPKGDPDPAGVWKPSEEQMKALQNAVALTACDKELARLYNQLKKL